MSNEIFYKSIKEIRQLYQKKEATVLEITNLFLGRIKNLNNELNAFLDIYEQDSKIDSAKADQFYSEGKNTNLTGVIVGLKDLVDVKDKITSAGSEILEKNFAKNNAKITDDFQNERSVIIGKN